MPPVPGLSGTPGPAMREQSAHHDQQIAIPQKRYSHLPLVADELKKKGDGMGAYQHPPDISAVSQKKKTGSQKKGVLGFLKK